jgi:hypothetical protein
MSDTPLYIPYFRDNNLWLDYRAGVKGNSFTWAWERKTTDVQYLAIHHSVTNIRPDWVGVDGARKYADEIATFHISGRGWGGIGYHMIVCPDGYLTYVGDMGTARANVANINEKVVGICMIGDFTKHLPTDAQIHSMHELTWWFDGQRAVWTNLKTPWDTMVQGHKELNKLFGNPGTACPGSSYPVDMKERIKNDIPYTAPPTPPTPPPVTQPPETGDPEPPPAVTPPPTPPSPCCQELQVQINNLTQRVTELENKSVWDLIKKTPSPYQK